MMLFFKLPNKKGLILNVPTKCFIMLYHIRMHLLNMRADHYSGLDAPTLDDWRKAELVTKFLKTIVDTT